MITSFPIQTRNVPLTISDHYAVEPIIPLQPCLKKKDCLYYPKWRNLNKQRQIFSGLLFSTESLCGLKSKFTSIDEDTAYMLGIINENVEKIAPEEYITPTKVKNTLINNRLKII